MMLSSHFFGRTDHFSCPVVLNCNTWWLRKLMPFLWQCISISRGCRKESSIGSEMYIVYLGVVGVRIFYFWF